MIMTNKLKMDLQSPGCTPIIHAAQNDHNTRKLEITLLADGKPLQIPTSANVSISYQSPYGLKGTYDTLENGTPAWDIRGNILTITLVPRMFILPGSVDLSVKLIYGQTHLGSFPILLYLYPSSLTAPEQNPDHFHVTSFLPVPEQAAVGQLFQVDSVDEWGTVTAVSAINPEDLWNRDTDAAYISQYLDNYFAENPFLSEESDPTVPDWAKASAKPSYTAKEVGALPENTAIPGKLSDLANDCGLITKAVQDLEHYYRKSETYSREEIDRKITSIPKFTIRVVSALPETDISETAIYLLPGGDTGNLYTEYLYANGSWEILGSQQVDLTGYATQIWVADQLTSYQPKGDYVLASEIPTVPVGVAAEASRVVDTTLTREDSRTFRFIAFSDTHQKNDHEFITAGNKELGQALGEVLRQIGVDFVANLGDITWGESSASEATVLEESKTFNTLVADSIHGETQLWLEGNHETTKLTVSQISALIYSHNKHLTQDANHWMEGYGYLDFPNQKIRVVCLNTNQGSDTVICGVSDTQLKWFAETALNMEGKTDWSLLTLGHHPLSYNDVTLVKNCATVMEAFLTGGNLSFTTSDATTISMDYSTKRCTYIGHIHGHAHAFSVVKMQKYVSSGVYKELDAWEICIPNACYERNNQYWNNGAYTARYATPITYAKEDTDGKRTAFNIITVCLDRKMIYADHYGAGIDREISYDFTADQTYTNQIPISTDTDGSIYGGDYNGDGVKDGYKTDTYLSGGNPGTRAGVETTGFIPFDGSGTNTLYLSGIGGTPSDNNFRIAMYTSDGTYCTQLQSSQFKSNNYASIDYTTGSDGNYTRVDLTVFTDAYKGSTGQTLAKFRLCASEINHNSIITVNEPIG